MSKHPLISIEMVSKTYGDDPLDFKTLVLKNIYLQIFEGEFLVIFGPSGSGKSTLLNLMAGLEFPTAGRVLVRRKDISKFAEDEISRYHRLRMGMVFQQFNLIKSLSVWENVALPQTANGVRHETRKKRALKLLKMFNVDHYADRHPNEISGGEQQRVAIARALINNPYFLLVDEPTGNLDSKSAEEVMKILHELHLTHKHTIVMVTHNPNHLRFATRIIYVEDGKIIIEENRQQDGEDTTSAPSPATNSSRSLEQTTVSSSKNSLPPTTTSLEKKVSADASTNDHAEEADSSLNPATQSDKSLNHSAEEIFAPSPESAAATANSPYKK